MHKCHVNHLVGEHNLMYICTTLEKGRTYVSELILPASDHILVISVRINKGQLVSRAPWTCPML